MIDRVIARTLNATILTAALSAALVVALAPGNFASAQTLQIPLSGIGTVQSTDQLGVNPPLLASGDVELGSQSTQSFEISHQGDATVAPIDIISLTVEGQDSFEFSVDNTASASLAPGQTLQFNVTFAPATLGEKTAFLRVEHSGLNSPHLILLSGKGIDVPASQLAISSGEVDFGTVETDESDSKTITLTNMAEPGYPAVNVYSVVTSGSDPDLFTTNFANALTIAPGQSHTITVTVNSSIAGKKEAVLLIDHDGENPQLKSTLTATVVLPPPDPQDEEEEEEQNNNNGVDPEFLQTKLQGISPKNPTSLQIGPDGKLYVTERDGNIYQYTVQRSAKNTYTTSQTSKIELIQKMTNHDDDGSVNSSVKGRLVTGILVAGTAQNPVIYIASGDPRMAAGPSGKDVDLDTNSVVISRLTQNGNNWSKQDLVRGLPRSEENHQGNGLALSDNGNILYVSMGGHTNMGVPSNNFARLPEYALSAAIIEINLNQIGNNTYDLPTLDDEDRGGVNDANDPFGGNNGKNMAILEANGPVDIYSPGWRNAYDIVITEAGRMYTIDNGPNSGWGGTPPANCSNQYADGGSTYKDGLHYITGKGYYGGHPNPTRGSKNNTFNDSNPQTPIEGGANPKECEYKIPVQQDGALYIFNASTNGLDEYTASNFGGSMKGDLLAASFDKSVHRVQLNNAGNKLIGIDKIFPNLGTPLDVVAQGDNEPFPGTVWVVDYSQGAVHVFEPVDYQQ